MNILMLLCGDNLMWTKIGEKVYHPVEMYRSKIFYKRIEVYTNVPLDQYEKTVVKILKYCNKWGDEEAKEYCKRLNIKYFKLQHDFERGQKTQLKFSVAKQALSKLVAGMSQPFTTVVSTNFAHNLSAPLSQIAFEKSKTSKSAIKLVINMDYHYDCGDGSSGEKDSVDNGAWGQHHVLKKIKTGNAHVYATFGVLNEYAPGGIFIDGEGLQRENISGLDKNSLMNKIESVVKTYKENNFLGVDIYVTVDRDVLTYGATHFSPGKEERGIVIRTVDPLIARLRKYGSVNIVGFDITGLPKAGGEVDPMSAITNKAACDINDWCGIIQRHMM